MCDCGSPFHESDVVVLTGESGVNLQSFLKAVGFEIGPLRVSGYDPDDRIVEVQAPSSDPSHFFIAACSQDDVVRLALNDE